MTAHPYPQKLVTAVANVLWPEMYVSGRAYELADKALSALWEASRVDAPEQLDALPYGSVLIDVNGVVADDYVTHCIVDLPAHVLHWGDAR